MSFSVFYFHSLFIIKINSLLHFACWFVCLLDKRDSGTAFSDCRARFSALHQRAAKLQQDWRRSAVSSLQGPAEPLARLRNQGRFSSGLVLHQASASRCVCKNNQQEVKGQAAAFSLFSTASPHDYGSFAQCRSRSGSSSGERSLGCSLVGGAGVRAAGWKSCCFLQLWP